MHVRHFQDILVPCTTKTISMGTLNTSRGGQNFNGIRNGNTRNGSLSGLCDTSIDAWTALTGHASD